MDGSGHVAIGGKVDEKNCYIEPTLLVDVKSTDPIMKEEVRGRGDACFPFA